MLEKVVEDKLIKLVNNYGGVCLKFTSPGTTGVPDRIVITPKGKIHFVELKRPKGGKLSARQEYMHQQLVSRGANVWLLWSVEEVLIFVKEVFTT